MNQEEKAKKRVELAKDVLARFAAGTLQSRRQGYCLMDLGGECNVCAVGALAVQCCQPKHAASAFDIFKCLKPYFTLSQLELIEAAFEQRTDGFISYNRGKKPTTVLAARVAAMNKYPKFKNIAMREERLKEIMRNIIRNKGTFVV